MSAASLIGVVTLTAWAVVLLVAVRSRDRSRGLELSRQPAERLAAALGLAAPVPSREPHRSGMWSLTGKVEGVDVRMLVGRERVLLFTPLAATGNGAEPWDLLPTSQLGPGGVANPPDNPYRALADDVLGPGW